MPLLRRAAPSRIVNVGSIFGDIAYPLFAPYSASKFALRGLSIAMRREFKTFRHRRDLRCTAGHQDRSNPGL